MNQHQAKRVIISVESEAIAIEQALKDYLIPPARGLYTAVSKTPLFEPLKSYHYLSRGDGVMTRAVVRPILNLEMLLSPNAELLGDVYDSDGELVWNRRTHGQLFPSPQRATVGLEIVRNYLDYYIEKRLPWVTSARDLGERLQPYFSEDFLQVSVAVLDAAETIFERNNYSSGERMRVMHVKFGQVMVPIGLVEVQHATPLMDWVDELLFSLLAVERATVAQYVEYDLNANYIVEERHGDLHIVHGGDHRDQATPTSSTISEHQKKARPPTASEVERSHSGEESNMPEDRPLPPGMRRRSVPKPPAAAGLLDEVLDIMELKASFHKNV